MCKICNDSGKRAGSDYLDCTACSAADILAAFGEWHSRHPAATPAEIFQHGRDVERAALPPAAAAAGLPADKRAAFEVWAKASPTPYDLRESKYIGNGVRTYHQDRTQWAFEAYCGALSDLPADPVDESQPAEDDKADAERYRWLRDESGADCACEGYWGSSSLIVDINDEAIDRKRADSAAAARRI